MCGLLLSYGFLIPFPDDCYAGSLRGDADEEIRISSALVEKGFPQTDGQWQVQDYRTAVEALERVDLSDLPRRDGSSGSGPLFDKLSSENARFVEMVVGESTGADSIREKFAKTPGSFAATIEDVYWHRLRQSADLADEYVAMRAVRLRFDLSSLPTQHDLGQTARRIKKQLSEGDRESLVFDEKLLDENARLKTAVSLAALVELGRFLALVEQSEMSCSDRRQIVGSLVDLAEISQSRLTVEGAQSFSEMVRNASEAGQECGISNELSRLADHYASVRETP
jgi:hypothetical protein